MPEPSKPRVLVHCACGYIHKIFDYADTYVFIRESLQQFAETPCPVCSAPGLELFIDAVAPESEAGK